MKRKTQIAAFFALCAVLLAACSHQQPNSEKLLKDSGLSNVDTYLQMVSDYQKGKTPEQDFNCRTAAFTLLEDTVSAAKQENYSNYLMFDMDAIDNDKAFKAIQDHKSEFIALFEGASVESVPNDRFEQVYPALLKERNVKFSNDKAALISVVMHDPDEKRLFVGHAGVLVKNGNSYQFFEKLAPNEEYQSKIFASKEDLKKELLSRSNYFEKGAHNPMIYENGVLLK